MSKRWARRRAGDQWGVSAVVPGGGTGPEDWTNVDLTVTGGTPDGFHLMAQDGATLDDWTFSNPSADILRVRNDAQATNKWQVATQSGPILMLKDQIVPRTFTNPAGITGNQWRSEDAILMVELSIGTSGFENLRTGNKGEGLQVGPIVVWFTDDQGTGAALVTSDPTPLYNGSTYGGSSYYTSKLQKNNNDGTHNWKNVVTFYDGGGVNWNQPDEAGQIGSVGNVNTIRVSTAPRYVDTTQGNQGGIGVCMFDNRVDTGSPDSIHNNMGHQWRSEMNSERKYTYIGISVGNNGPGVNSPDTQLDIISFRYLVQPLRNRSL